jgi:hypothetical protein
VRGDDEQRGGAQIGGHGVEEIEGRSVAPMQVLEYQHEQRSCRPCGAHRVEQLTQHAITRGTDRAGPELIGGIGRDEAGQLQHPAGSQLRESLDERLSVRCGARLAHRAEHRHIGLASAPQLDALADADGHIGRERGEELLYHRRLANAGRPGKEHHLAITAHRSRESFVQLCQLALAASEMWRLPAGWRLDAGCLTSQGANEPVAPSVGSADERLTAAIVANRSTSRLDAGGEGRLADETVTPDVVEELLLGDDPIPVLDKVGEHVEDLWLDRNGHTRPAELVAGEVQLVAVECVDHPASHAGCPTRIKRRWLGRRPLRAPVTSLFVAEGAGARGLGRAR